jgi:hypothetical protein
MKWLTLIVLSAVVASIGGPPLPPPMHNHGDRAEIRMLDVCHSATPALSSNGEMPCVFTRPSSQVPVASIARANISDPIFPQFLFPQQNDQPPKA